SGFACLQTPATNIKRTFFLPALFKLLSRVTFIKQRPEVTAYLLVSVIVVGLDCFHKLSQGTFILTEKDGSMT
uniref:Uncharacterized protein n=1 Tax=Xiphophorus couchianus TaxID=32473 RepID=A0A3B5L0I0_9TELE